MEGARARFCIPHGVARRSLNEGLPAGALRQPRKVRSCGLLVGTADLERLAEAGSPWPYGFGMARANTVVGRPRRWTWLRVTGCT